MRCPDRCRGRLVFVSGEAGVGKTRLVEELRQALVGSVWVLTGSPYPGTSVAFGPLAESLRSARRRHPAFWEAAEVSQGGESVRP
ncbi:MAG TPA: ATP-binding protein [Actinomycetota bacterium]|nr:ATP-binding protein [Actinomycetota bacterium]